MYRTEIEKLADGADLWTNEKETEGLKSYVSNNFLPFPSNNQLPERWVKDSNECTYLSKDEKMSNLYAIDRS